MEIHNLWNIDYQLHKHTFYTDYHVEMTLLKEQRDR